MKRKIKKYTRKIKLNNKIYKSKKLKTNKSKKLKTNKSKKLKTNKSKKLKTNKSIIIFLIDTNKIKKMKGGSGNGTLKERSLAFKKLEKTAEKIKKYDESKITKITYNDNIEQMINDVKKEVDFLSETELKPALQIILLDLVELVGEARVASYAANYLIRKSSPFIKFIIKSLNEIADSTVYTLDYVMPEIIIIRTTLSNLKNKLNEIKESFKKETDTTLKETDTTLEEKLGNN